MELHEPYLEMEREAELKSEFNSKDGERLELHAASYKGDLPLVRHLIEAKEQNPLAKDNDGNTALHYASRGGQLDVFKYLVEEQSCNSACFNSQGLTPLHVAAKSCHLRLVQYLTHEQQWSHCFKTRRVLLHYIGPVLEEICRLLSF